MTGEYLSSEEAERVKLPVLNRFARREKIQEFAGQLATGVGTLEDVKVRTRFQLILLAKICEGIVERRQALTRFSEDTAANLLKIRQNVHEEFEIAFAAHTTIPYQPTLFEELGEENGKDF